MSFCPKCGKELVNNTSICENCGADVAQQQVSNQECQQETVYVDPVATETQYQSTPNQQQYQSAPNQPPYQSAPNQPPYQSAPNQYQYQANPYYPPTITEDMLPPEYKPVSIWAYLGYSILFSLPVIGLIMLFIVAFGSNYSKSLRNFAKYNLIMIAISTVLAVLFYVFFFVVFGLTASGMMDEFMYY